MKYWVFLFCFFASFVYGIETPQPSRPRLENVSFLRDTAALSHEDALMLLRYGTYRALPNEAISFGADDATYWVAFNLPPNPSQRFYLEFLYDQLSRVESFVYDDDRLVHTSINGNSVPIEQREVHHPSTRFMLFSSEKTLTYLFKINSHRPLILALYVGTQAELDYQTYQNVLPIIFFLGGVVLVFFVNLMLFYEFKMKAYGYYALYLMSVCFFVLCVNNFIVYAMHSSESLDQWFKMLSITGVYVSMLLFTIHVLDLRRFSLFWLKSTYLFCCVIAFLFPLFFVHRMLFAIFATSAFILPLYTLLIAFFAVLKRIRFAVLYTIGLFGFHAGMLVYWLTQMGFIPLFPLAKTGIIVGSFWEMIFFIWILVLQSKQTQRQYHSALMRIREKEQEQLNNAKFISIGRTIGNVTHQWRQPLNALGAVLTHVKASLLLHNTVRKQPLLDSLDTSFEILQHLSETIDTFYRFLLKAKSNDQTFCVSKQMEILLNMLAFSFKNLGIEIQLRIQSDAILLGNANEFMQAILNILQNAKDQFEIVRVPHPMIRIVVKQRCRRCRIVIIDNAGGIRIHPIERIFLPHVCAKADNSGIGLFLVKEIIEKRFHGTISVRNYPKGALFIMRLPTVE